MLIYWRNQEKILQESRKDLLGNRDKGQISNLRLPIMQITEKVESKMIKCNG